MRSQELTVERGSAAAPAGRLEEEIATLERRLDEIGPDGDCGYEKAMIRFFLEQIERRRKKLRAIAEKALD